MKSLSTLKRAGKLRRLTHLEPIAMLDRFFCLEEAIIKALNDPDLNVLSPSGRDLAELKLLHKEMKQFQKVTLKLQNPAMNLLTVRDLIDEVIETYPLMKSHLAKDAPIVKNPIFESAVFVGLKL